METDHLCWDWSVSSPPFEMINTMLRKLRPVKNGLLNPEYEVKTVVIAICGRINKSSDKSIEFEEAHS